MADTVVFNEYFSALQVLMEKVNRAKYINIYCYTNDVYSKYCYIYMLYANTGAAAFSHEWLIYYSLSAAGLRAKNTKIQNEGFLVVVGGETSGGGGRAGVGAAAA